MLQLFMKSQRATWQSNQAISLSLSLSSLSIALQWNPTFKKTI